MNSCCHNCPNRVPPTKDTKGCRSTCEKWAIEEKANQERYKRYTDGGYQGYKRENEIRVEKRVAKKKWGK